MTLALRTTGMGAALAPAFSLRGVGRTYRTGAGETVALSDVDLDVATGEAVVLLGPSGCGKTTLLRIVAGLDRPSTGTYARDDGRRLGMVFQEANLFPWFRVDDNIGLPLRVAGVRRAERRRRAGDLAELVGLAGFERRYPRHLSGGMRQRAALARALASEPDLVLMDEPFGALDAMTRDAMNLETQRLFTQRGVTLVLVTHSITEAVFLADRVVLMSPRPGRIEAIVPVSFPRPRTLDLQSTAPFQQIVRELRRRLGGTP